MRRKGALPTNILTVIAIIVAILIHFATPEAGPLRSICLLLLAVTLLYLAYELYIHIPKRLSLIIILLVAAVAVLAIIDSKWPIPWPWATSEVEKSADPLAAAFLEGQNRYSRGDYEGTIEVLEPFEGTDRFEAKQYHLLGLAYLSLPEPRCTDAIRLLPRVTQRDLEVALGEKCKAVSCRQCKGGIIL